MRAVVQRVTQGDVTAENRITGSITKGLVVFLGVGLDDSISDAVYMAEKIAGLRIFEDAQEKMNLSVQDIGGEILAISQFTLFGDVKKGKRPSFSSAAKPEEAVKLYREFCEALKKTNLKVEEGIFQSDMLVRIYNDGPVTILIDSKKEF